MAASSTLRQHNKDDVVELRREIKHMLRQAWFDSQPEKEFQENRSPKPMNPQDVFETLRDKVQRRFAASPHVHTAFLVAVHRCVKAERRFKRKQISRRKLNEAKEQSREEVKELFLDHQALRKEFRDCCLTLADLQWQKKKENDESPMEEVD